MQTKIQELTEKIYNEGVEKARQEAEAIINEAKEKAASLEEDARKSAESIVKEAEEKAETLKKHVDSELKMSINQAVAALKQDLASLVTMKAVQPGVKELFNNMDFLQEVVVQMVKGWAEKESVDIKVVLSEKNQRELEKHFKNQLADELNKGLELAFSDGVKSGFKVGPADGSYQISFSDQDFINFFKTYLRPKTSELLFEEKK
ncbi:V-type ATP synthase subunit E [Alkalitalea saponilacus]|nr:V-type ATP synthase subunit E [Alkalitalea saponilacus]ASB49743.1 V-type ATP synthase subunit E [Alkalitalea saponilacus]